MSNELADRGDATVVKTGAPSFEEAIAFIWAEADMLDRLDYKPWLKLWAPDGRYIIPIERAAADHADALNILYDDRIMREARVKRLLSGFSMSSAPPARTVRTVSRFVVTGRDETSISLRCAQMLAAYKYEQMHMLPADVSWRIGRGADGELCIEEKVVLLINADDFQHGMGYLI